ncbi:FAD/NAD(P)-binding domain-containing protein [Scleroderma citrinum]
MSLPQSTCTLIVGAGPTDFVIVDAVTKGQNTSRAIIIHAATTEALDTIGCADDLVATGTKLPFFTLATRSIATLVRVPFELLKPYTKYPYGLVIPQSLTEHILEQKLASFGVTVHRPCRVIGMKPNSSNAKLADVTFEDGQVITAKYIIAADGARSTIRSIAGINFVDPSKEDNNTTIKQVALADVTFDDENLDGFPTIGILSPGNYFLCVSFPSTFTEYLANETGKPIKGRIFRLSTSVPNGGNIPSSPSKEYMQNLVNTHGPLELSSDPSVNPSSKSVRIKDVVWSSCFRTHCAIADTFFTRLPTGDASDPQGPAILLVGDAAHMHSPAGGQGMNLGLRDAIFLGEALTKHINAAETQPLSDADIILTSFTAGQRSLALEIVGFTKRLLSITGVEDEGVAWWLPISKVVLRDWVLWVLGKVWFIQRMWVWNMSGLGRR